MVASHGFGRSHVGIDNENTTRINNSNGRISNINNNYMRTIEIKDKIKQINDILQKGEPNNWSKDHKGYAGYKPQAVIDAVNESGLEWSLEILETSTRESGRTNKNGQEIVDVLVKVRITIENQKIDAVASHPITDDYGDAMKSAQTDAMKKAFAHFSIGNRAYHGLLTSKVGKKAYQEKNAKDKEEGVDPLLDDDIDL